MKTKFSQEITMQEQVSTVSYVPFRKFLYIYDQCIAYGMLVCLCVYLCIYNTHTHRHIRIPAKTGMRHTVMLLCIYKMLKTCLGYLFMSTQAKLPHSFYRYIKFHVWLCHNLTKHSPSDWTFRWFWVLCYKLYCLECFLWIYLFTFVREYLQDNLLEWNCQIKGCVFLLLKDMSNCINLYSLQQWLNVPLPILLF